MVHKIVKKQYSSHMCFVCGIHNDAGLHTHFYALENKQLVGIFKGQAHHQSYPQRMHGGIIVALLDETMGRAIQEHDPSVWGVTVELAIRYIKPVPLFHDLKAVGYITNNRRLLFEGEGYLCDENNQILATAKAKYIKQSVGSIVTDQDFEKEQWIFVEDDEPLTTIELPK